MDVQAERVTDFLYELYKQANDHEFSHVSMHSVGANIGMDKTDATALAEELMINELVELKTLAGEIGITSAGLEFLQMNNMIADENATSYELSGEPVLTDGDQKIIHEILSALKLELVKGTSKYEHLEEAVVDIKTLEVQLLSPYPKTAIALAILCSLKQSFQKNNLEEFFSSFTKVFRDLC